MLDTEAGGPSAPTRPLTVEGHMGLVHREARRCIRRARHLQYEDLVQEGVIGLMRGLRTFNPALGSPGTYLTHWISHQIRRAIDNQDREIRLPCWFVNKLHRQKELRHEGRVSLAQPLGENFTLEGMLPGKAEGEDEILARLDQAEMDRNFALAVSELPERLRCVLRGRSEGHTLQVIGAERGLSRERIRQLEMQALGLLRCRLGSLGR